MIQAGYLKDSAQVSHSPDWHTRLTYVSDVNARIQVERRVKCVRCYVELHHEANCADAFVGTGKLTNGRFSTHQMGFLGV